MSHRIPLLLLSEVVTLTVGENGGGWVSVWVRGCVRGLHRDLIVRVWMSVTRCGLWCLFFFILCLRLKAGGSPSCLTPVSGDYFYFYNLWSEPMLNTLESLLATLSIRQSTCSQQNMAYTGKSKNNKLGFKGCKFKILNLLWAALSCLQMWSKLLFLVDSKVKVKLSKVFLLLEVLCTKIREKIRESLQKKKKEKLQNKLIKKYRMTWLQL